VYPGTPHSLRPGGGYPDGPSPAPNAAYPPAYGPASPYESPYDDPSAYRQSAYAPTAPYPQGPGSAYDSGATQVFESGLLPGAHAYGEAGRQGFAPPYDDDFGRSDTARIDFGPHAAFGPPPGEEEPEAEADAAHIFTRLRRIRSHAAQRRPRRRRAWIAVVIVLALFAAGATARFAPFSPWRGGFLVGHGGSSAMPFHDALITPADVGTDGFLSWAYQDLRDGTVVGSDNMGETTQSASMLAAWFGADFLRRAAETGQDPSDTDLADVQAMIRDDDLEAADRVVAKLGGAQESISRLGPMCDLSDTQPVDGPWLQTPISARDAARLGGCLATRRAAGAQWTPWLLNVMREVRGTGDFGIREAFPDDQRPSIAIKNGMALDQQAGQLQANCLAIGETWALAILQRFTATNDPNADLAHADSVCRQVVSKLTAGT
jgi:hypothetical protein